MGFKGAFTAFAASYFVLIFLRNGTFNKLVQDASRGAQDVGRGLGGAARIA